MKTYKMNTFRLILYTIFTLLLVIACQKINPFEDVDLTVNTSIYKSPILIRFVDGNANATKTPDGLTVSITGTGKDLVLNDAGGSDYKVVDNILTLVLKKDAKPSQSNPIEFTVSVSGVGYVSNSKTVIVTNPDDALQFVVPLTNLANPPRGSVAQNETLSLTAGQTLTIPSTTEKPGVAQLTIASGTQVKDETDNVINSTNVKTQVVQYGNVNEEALNSFPGGIIAEKVTSKDGKTTNGVFTPIGFMSIDMEANGKKVTSFSKPIDIKMGVSNELINPVSNQKVNEGDNIPTWSYDSQTGKWREEGLAIITKGSDGKLTANFKVPHLSYWGLGYYSPSDACPKNNYILAFIVTSNVNNSVSPTDYSVRLYSINNLGVRRFIGSYWSFDVRNGNRANGLTYLPNSGSKYQIDVYANIGNKLIGSSAPFEPCTNSDVPITLSVPNPPTYLDIDIDFTAKCANKDVNIKPSTYILFEEPSIGHRVEPYIRDGKGSVTLREGREYIFYALYEWKSYSGKIIINKSSTSITSIRGADLSIIGTTTYNPETSRVQVNAFYEIKNCK